MSELTELERAVVEASVAAIDWEKRYDKMLSDRHKEVHAELMATHRQYRSAFRHWREAVQALRAAQGRTA